MALSRLVYRIDNAVISPERLLGAAWTLSALLALVIAIAFGEPMPGAWWEQALLWTAAFILLASILLVPVFSALWLALRMASAALMAASIVLEPIIELWRLIAARPPRARP